MPWEVCSTPGCPNLIDHGARCQTEDIRFEPFHIRLGFS